MIFMFIIVMSIIFSVNCSFSITQIDIAFITLLIETIFFMIVSFHSQVLYFTFI